MSVIADLPDLRPSLLLDFANSRKVDPRIQCIRASTATCFGPDGKLRTVAADVPRIDYDPATGKCLGLLVEGSRTNLAPNSGDFTAASWGKTRSTVSAPDADGWCKITETSTGVATHTVTRSIATEGATTYTFSVDLKAGTRTVASLTWGNFVSQEEPIAIYLNLISGEMSGTGPGRYTLRKLSDGWRFSITTTTVTSPSVNILATIQMGVEMGQSLYPGDGVSYLYARNAQIEVGNHPSSYIPTEAVGVTRASDVVRLDLYDLLPRDGYTLLMRTAGDYAAEYPCIFSDSVSSLGNFVGPRMAPGGCYINSTEGGRSVTIPRPEVDSWTTLAAAVANDASGGVGIDGVTGAGSMRPAADFKTRRYLKFATVSGSAAGSRRYSRLSIYPAVLTSSQLQRLTT